MRRIIALALLALALAGSVAVIAGVGTKPTLAECSSRTADQETYMRRLFALVLLTLALAGSIEASFIAASSEASARARVRTGGAE